MAVYEVGGQRFEIDDSVQGEQLNNALTQLAAQIGQAQQAEQQQKIEERGFFGDIKAAFTGEDRITPEIEGLSEVGNAPELNELSMGAFNTAFGLLSAGDDQEAAKILTQNIPEAKTRVDSKGNTIVDLPSGQYLLNAPGFTGQDIARTLFSGLAFTPAGRATTIPKAVGGAAATQTGLEATQAATGGDVDVSDIALAGGLEGVTRGLGEAVGAVARARQGRQTGVITPEEQIIQQAEQVGVPLQTTDVLPPQTFAGQAAREIAEKIPLAGTGGLRANQQLARQEAVQQFADSIGASADKDFSQEIFASLKAERRAQKDKAGAVIDDITAQAAETGAPVTLAKTIDAIDAQIAKLTRPGIIRQEDVIRNLEEMKNNFSVAQSFDVVKENRSIVRNAIDDISSGGRSVSDPTALKSAYQNIYRSLTDDMGDFITGSLGEKQAKQWRGANKAWGDILQEGGKTRLRNVLNTGDITPESAYNLLFSNKPSEVKLLMKNLDQSGKEAARAALVSKAFKDATKTGEVNPTLFLNQLNKNKGQIGAAFTKEQSQQVEGLVRVLEATRTAQAAPVLPKTGLQAVGVGGLGAAIYDLSTALTAGATIGTVAKAYESKPMRNFLIQLGKVKKGSTAEEKLLEKIVPTFNAIIRANTGEQPQETQ